MDLITHILTRLPVKSLARVKSVSKFWYSLIQSPNFIKLHLKLSKLNPHPIFSSILSLHNAAPHTHVFRRYPIDALDNPIVTCSNFMLGIDCWVLGISDGLVCVKLIHKASFDIIVCNPVTGNFRIVPPFQPTSLDYDNSTYGFSSNEDGFEVLRIDRSSTSVNVTSFSLSTNIWKDIVKVKMGKDEISTYPNAFPEPSDGYEVPVFKNGVFYWHAYDRYIDRRRVMIFDVTSEVLHEIWAPADTCSAEWGLEELKGQLLLSIHLEDKKFDLWMLNDEDKTWEIFKSVDVGDCIGGDVIVGLLGCAGNGKLVLSSNREELYLYDMDTKDVNILPYVSDNGEYGMYLFAESLASVWNL